MSTESLEIPLRTDISYEVDCFIVEVDVFCSLISIIECSVVSRQGESAQVPEFIVERHLVRDKTEIEDISRAFKLCAFEFVIYVGRCFNCVASYNSVIVSV